MISKTLLKTVVLGDFDKPGGEEHHIRLFGDATSHDDPPRVIWVDFQVFHVAGSSSDGKRMFAGPDHPVDSYEEAEPDAEGFVKWDGCTQFTMDVHVDHRSSLETLFDAVLEARRLAALEMRGQIVADEYSEYL